MSNYSPVKLIEYVRDELVEQEHYGFVVKVISSASSRDEECCLSNKIFPESILKYDISKIGDDRNYPYYLRSCAKPLQASLLIDYRLDEFYNMTSEEIAICCASHTGEPCHVDAVKTLLNKIGLDESYYKCGLHKPLSKKEKEKLLLSSECENVFQNNCSGKHTMKLAICKKMDWGLSDYDSPEHPLQIAIKKKIYELSEIKQEYPVTKDGCGVPIMSMPLENMIKGYLNLFQDEKYEKIRDAFLKNPYLIGGEDRLDTAIMCANSDLIAKVGAGGLCIVINIRARAGIIVKIMDCDMRARAITLIEALSQLGWLDKTALENPLIKEQNKRDILTLHGEKIGYIKTLI